MNADEKEKRVIVVQGIPTGVSAAVAERIAQEDEYARSEQERQQAQEDFYAANPHEGDN